MYKTFSLMDFLPVYNYSKDKELEQGSPEINSDWVNNRNEIGEAGEKLVKKFLEIRYKAKVEKQPDYKGFDFSVEIGNRKLCVEVKTSTKDFYNQFYMSFNEIKKAREFGEKYYLFFVYLSEGRNKLYIMNNPYKVLQLEHVFDNIKSNDSVVLTIESIRCIIKDMEEFIEVACFSDY